MLRILVPSAALRRSLRPTLGLTPKAPMGIDIYWVFQACKDDQWVDISSEYNGDRDYYLYNWIDTELQPPASRRGFPPDFLLDDDGNTHPLETADLLPPCKRKYVSGGQGLYQFMGSWGYSWLSGEEISSAPIPVKRLEIWLPIDVYREWDGRSNPKLWHELRDNWQEGEHSERYATPETITNETWRVIIEWDYDFKEHFEYFVCEVRRLIAIHGKIRFVFGFG